MLAELGSILAILVAMVIGSMAIMGTMWYLIEERLNRMEDLHE